MPWTDGWRGALGVAAAAAGGVVVVGGAGGDGAIGPGLVIGRAARGEGAGETVWRRTRTSKRKWPRGEWALVKWCGSSRTYHSAPRPTPWAPRGGQRARPGKVSRRAHMTPATYFPGGAPPKRPQHSSSRRGWRRERGVARAASYPCPLTRGRPPSDLPHHGGPAKTCAHSLPPPRLRPPVTPRGHGAEAGPAPTAKAPPRARPAAPSSCTTDPKVLAY
eukprot:scaffold2639_cov385-Prasinococcus_capsulatus_cf.AAC.8